MDASAPLQPSPSQAAAALQVTALLHAMNKTPQSPSAAADLFDRIRHTLPDLPPTHDATPIAHTAVRLIRHDPSNLLLAHRAVAVLAHPALCAAPLPVERTVVAAMDRLNMSAAFQHTAMAALQNVASARAAERDTVVLAVVTAMRQHHTQNGILLRGADLIAFHLNQPTASPLTSTYRVASRIVVDTAPKLAATPQGASTALLALIAAARHARSIASFASGRPSAAARFSRSGTAGPAAAIVDAAFAAAVVAAMSRHAPYAPVQALACDLMRVCAAGSSSPARHAARELHAAGAPHAVLAALHAHAADPSVVDHALVALRALLLGGASHGRALKPSLPVADDLVRYTARVADAAADAIAVKDRDLSAAAAVLAMDVRAALATSSGSRHRDRDRPDRAQDPSRLTGLGRRIMRRIRFGQKHSWYDQEYDRFAEEHHLVGKTESSSHPHSTHSHPRNPSLSNAPSPSAAATATAPPDAAARKDAPQRARRVSARSSFSVMHAASPYKRGASSQDMKDAARPLNLSRIDVVKANRKMSEGAALADPDAAQISLNKKWRSVSGRWNQRGRRGSTVSTSIDASRSAAAAAAAAEGLHARRERRGPLTLSGSEMANLSRQPSRIFGSQPAGDPFCIKADPRMRERRAPFVSGGDDDFGF